ncbi:MAG: hypothetical protein ACYC7J_19310 [Syntrophales bacterium]
MRQRQRIVLDLVKRQLASIPGGHLSGSDQQSGSPSAGPLSGSDRRPVFFRGDNKSIEFVSRIPLTPGSRFGMFHVKYAVKRTGESDREELTFYEQDAAMLDSRKGADGPGEGDFFPLLAGMKSIGFEYLKDRPTGEASLWQENWDPAVEKGVPRAVRITLDAGEEKAPLYVIAGAAE